MIVHLLEFRVVPGHEAEVAGYLSHDVLAASPSDGLISRFVGRRLSAQGREHVAATTWRNEASFARDTGPEGLPAYLGGASSMLGDKAASTYRVVASTGLGSEGARVLRLYRTSIAADSVGLWKRRTLESVSQLVSKEGLLTVVAGVAIGGDQSAEHAGEACVAVMTAWTEWNRLLVATGGRLNEAILDTELVDIEGPATTDHFELLKEDPRPG
jgi:hypothetical protein